MTTEPQGDVGAERWADPSLTYDVVAANYADRFVDELDGKPFDRALLTRFAEALAAHGRPGDLVCDLGCGPGHIGAFLAGQGSRVMGLDRSIGMVRQARLHYPAMPVVQGDMGDLGLLGGSLQGIAAFYSLIHIPRELVLPVLGELRRVLAVGGGLLLAVHGGKGSLHATEMLEHPADLDATLFTLPELVGLLEAAGFEVDEAHERDPYADESLTKRLYAWAWRRT